MGEKMSQTKLLFRLVPGVVVFAAMLVSWLWADSRAVRSITPAAIVSPIEDVRLGYVQRQLVNSGFQETEVNQLLGDSRLELYPVKQVAYRAPNWPVVKRKLYRTAYVRKGKSFIAANQATFDSAQQEFGVPQEVVAGIIAIESDFGSNAGSTLIFNALYSRLKQWPEEKWLGQANNLVALATYCFEYRLDCYNIKGSYAGAIGMVQFMPNSLLAYGIDGDKDGVVDLSKPADAIPSAANFLKAHGWQKNKLKALTSYYGNPVGYPGIVLTYASLIAKDAQGFGECNSCTYKR